MKEKAQIYEIMITDSVMDMVHGNTRSIKELYIPKHNITFNCEKSGNWHCFKTPDTRYAYNDEARLIEEIDIDEKIVKNILSYIKQRKNMEKVKDWFCKRYNS